MPLAAAASARPWRASSSSSARPKSRRARVILPLSMLETSRMELISSRRRWEACSTLCRWSWPRGPWTSRCRMVVKPMMWLRGVRSSWLILARKVLLARFAASASSARSASSVARRVRSSSRVLQLGADAFAHRQVGPQALGGAVHEPGGQADGQHGQGRQAAQDQAVLLPAAQVVPAGHADDDVEGVGLQAAVGIVAFDAVQTGAGQVLAVRRVPAQHVQQFLGNLAGCRRRCGCSDSGAPEPGRRCGWKPRPGGRG